MSSASYAPAEGARVRRLVPETGLQAAIWALTGACVLAPVLPLLYASVQSKPIYASGRVFTLAAYQQLFADPAFWTAARSTLEFAAMTTVCSVVLGGSFAVLCSRTDVLGRRVYSRLFIAPILLPPLGIILGWNALYGPGGYTHDFVNQTLRIPFNLTAVPGMAVLGTAVAVPVVFLVCQAALSGIDSALENSARSVGASPLRALGRVTVPMLRPALLNSGLLVFTLSIESLGIPLVLGSPQGHDFIASYLYNTWSNAFTPDPPVVSAGATVLLACACALLLLRSKLLGDQARFVSAGRRGGAAGGVQLGKFLRLMLGALLGLYLVATTFAPIATLALSSVVSELTPLIAPWHLLTLDNWRTIGHGTFAHSIRRVLLAAARENRIPLIVGSCGTAGTDAGVDWVAEIALRVAAQDRLSFRMARIYSELEATTVIAAIGEGRVRGLPPCGDLSPDTVWSCSHIVALMGHDPIVAALEAGAEVVLAGRATDTSMVAAVALMHGMPAGPTWHAAKTVECGGQCTTNPAAGGVFVRIDNQGFTVTPLAPDAACTPTSVAAHMLYENADPFRLLEPTGTLYTSAATYTALDERIVRVEGSRFELSPHPTAKLEGTRLAGHETISIVGIRDPHILASLDVWLGYLRSVLEDHVRSTLELDPQHYDLALQCYGANAVLGPLEDSAGPAREIGLLFKVRASSQKTATAIAKTASSMSPLAGLHLPPARR